jgi:hypothetical protein
MDYTIKNRKLILVRDSRKEEWRERKFIRFDKEDGFVVVQAANSHYGAEVAFRFHKKIER